MTSEPWKMPPIAKVYEAIGALSDGRVTITDSTHASVRSSDGSKAYEVEISSDGREISSNDSASYWRGYLGYPAIAVMLARGFYGPRADVVKALSGIPWKELNTRFRNNYDRTIAEVLQRAEQNGYDVAAIRREAAAVLDSLRAASPLRGARRRPPPRVPKRP
jgi:hypothetical protein